MNFQNYFASLLRRSGDTTPRADEALRDFQATLRLFANAGLH